MSGRQHFNHSYERIYNFLLGSSFIFWTVAGSIKEYHSIGCTTSIRLSIIVINLVVAYNIITRKQVIKNGGFFYILACLPSFIIGSLAYRFAEPANLWSSYTHYLFISGAIITITAFLFLGKNFAIFPAMRGISAKGPYRLVRHPAYFGEMLLIFAFTLNGSGWSSVLLFLGGLAIAIRINIEEKLLKENEEYKSYKKNVRWKLIFGVW